MITNNLPSQIERMLPSMSGKSVHYDAASGQYYTDGWTSAAGNTYYKGLRLSNRIAISMDLGHGYAYLFVNGIHIYGFNGTDKRLIESRNYSRCTYSDSFVRSECENMIGSYIKSQLRLSGTEYSDVQIKELSQGLVAEAYTRQLR